MSLTDWLLIIVAGLLFVLISLLLFAIFYFMKYRIIHEDGVQRTVYSPGQQRFHQKVENWLDRRDAKRSTNFVKKLP